MAYNLYNPFKNLDFNYNVCFLTGNEISKENNRITVFPEWLMERYKLHETTFMMLAENKVNYESLILPVSLEAMEAINLLESKIEIAFKEGYDAVKKLDSLIIFQWLALRVYGILYSDIAHAQTENLDKGLDYKLSPYLTKRITNLHAMLQSIIIPMEFKTDMWSITVEKVKYSKDIFNYKDETKNLSATLAMHNFGIIACLQDNGDNYKTHESLLKSVDGIELHPIQFEELWCRFLYTNYLLRNSTDYIFENENSKIVVSSSSNEYSFEEWDDKIFSQVLTNYWKPWGIQTQDIYQYPGTTLTYLIDEVSNKVVDPETIALPW